MLGWLVVLGFGVCCLQLSLAAPSTSTESPRSTHWKDCGNQSESWIQFTALEVSPQPLQIPGNISLTLQGQATHAISGTLDLDVLIEERFPGGYATVPCRKGYGSCRFEDICGSLTKLRLMGKCPNIMTRNGISCACPGLNEYIRLNDVIEVPEMTSSWKWLKFPPNQQNEFRVRVRLRDSERVVRGCIKADLFMQG